jgi:hypothetical protein
MTIIVSKSQASSVAVGSVGSSQIADDSIVDADINSAAAISYSKLATLATGKILAGNANVPTATTLGGDATIGATGTLTIANSAVTDAKVAAANKDGAAGTASMRTLGSGAGAAMAGATILASGKGFVNHGATAGTARPTGYASVEWVGSVSPDNAIDGDTWVNTS